MSKNSYPSVQNIYPKMQNCNKMSEFLAPGHYNSSPLLGNNLHHLLYVTIVEFFLGFC